MHMLDSRPLLCARDPLPGDIHLALDHLSSGTANSLALLYTDFKVKDVHDVVGEVRREVLPLCHAEIRDLDASLLCESDRSSRDVMRLTERNLYVSGADMRCRWTYTFSDEVVGDISSQHVHRQGGLHLFWVDLRGSEQATSQIASDLRSWWQ